MDNTQNESVYSNKIVINGKIPKNFVKNKNNSIPKENALLENYPNPFNPSTQIKYSIKEDGLVTVKVFDMLGKEIALLVNEFKPAGDYSINFDASSLSSGIYFYSLTSGKYRETKKMILLR